MEKKYLDKLWKFEINALVVKQKAVQANGLNRFLNAGWVLNPACVDSINYTCDLWENH